MFKSKPERKQDAAKKHVQLAAENAVEALKARTEQARDAGSSNASSLLGKATDAKNAAVAATAPKLADAIDTTKDKAGSAQESFVDEILPKLAAAVATAATAAATAKAGAAEAATNFADTDMKDVKKAAYEGRGRAADAYAVLRGDAVAKPKRSGSAGLILLGLAAAGAAAYAAWSKSQPKNDPWAVPANDTYGKGMVETEHVGQRSAGQKLADAADTLKAKAADAAAVVQDKAGEARHGAADKADSLRSRDDETTVMTTGSAAGAAAVSDPAPRAYGSSTTTGTEENRIGSAVNAAEGDATSWGGAEITTLDELGQAPGTEPGTEQGINGDDDLTRRDRRDDDLGRRDDLRDERRGDAWTDAKDWADNDRDGR